MTHTRQMLSRYKTKKMDYGASDYKTDRFSEELAYKRRERKVAKNEEYINVSRGRK